MNNRFSFYIIASGLLFAVILFTTCAKEYSYEGGNTNPIASGSAVYTLTGAGGACIGSVLMGKYYAGSLLDATHNIQLQVNVTTAGTYNLNTNTVNGIKFFISGIFANTGLQTITLSGSGTPVVEGTFTFTTPGSGCSFKVTVKKLSDAVADFNLVGAPNACTDAAVSGNYVNGIPLTNDHNIVVVKVNVTAIGAYTIRTDTLGGISFSAAGFFTGTGTQTVTLGGSGTPVRPDNLQFTPMPSGGIPGCTFTVNVLNLEPVATYVLESGNGMSSPCIYTVAGTYTTNTALSVSNNISISVYVTILGNYTVATATVNGIRFYHTGMFTTLGQQRITLTGSGTPLVSGITSFTPQIIGPHPLGGQVCTFALSVN